MSYMYVLGLKGIDTIARKSKKVDFHNKSTWLPLYINYDKDMVTSEKDDGNYYLTDIINPCTRDDVIDIILKTTSY